MKAIVQTRFGPPSEVLELRDIDVPQAEAGAVLVRVHAASVAKGDWLIARGEPYLARPSYGWRTPRHPVAGLDVAGTVASVGPGIDGFRTGDEVFGWCQGSFAEFVAVPGEQLARKPARVNFAQAAAIPTSGCAALQAVRDVGQVEAGHQVLVIGAAGGVGSFAVQIAKAFGAEVTGVASTTNVELVRSLGADRVIDHSNEEITARGAVYDVVIDIAGNRRLALLREVLAPAGTLVLVGGTGGSATMGFGRTIRAMALTPFVKQHLRPLFSKPSQADLEQLADLLASDAVRAAIDQVAPLADAPVVVEQLGAGSSSGKRIIEVAA